MRSKGKGFYGIISSTRTVKAFNFGPQGHFGPFLARSVASLDEIFTKNEQNRVSKSAVFRQLSFFFSFSCKTRFDDTKSFWGKKSKVYMRS
jgi:hypothetical protein